MKTFLLSLTLSIAFLGAVATFTPISVQADVTNYTLLAPLPLNQPNALDNQIDAPKYIQGIIRLGIGIAGALAVLQIIIGGVQYVSTDSFQGKKDGQKTINQALYGLVLVIASYMILYTLNPRLLNFKLNITGQKVGESYLTPTDPISGGSPVGATSCGATCVPTQSGTMKDVPQKGPGGNCFATGGCFGFGCGGSACYVDAQLAEKLVVLNTNIDKKIPWIVSEMYPPTVPHSDPCHNKGTCVDTSINTGGLQPSIDSIAIFLSAIEKVGGLHYEYESCTRLAELQKSPKLAAFKSHLKCEPTTKGENAHIEL